MYCAFGTFRMECLISNVRFEWCIRRLSRFGILIRSDYEGGEISSPGFSWFIWIYIESCWRYFENGLVRILMAQGTDRREKCGNILGMAKKVLLSLILPAYNEEKRLPECMEKVADFVASHSDTIEVILVENGSNDRTYALGLEYAAKYPWLKVLQEKKPGKGNAVRRGMLEASGEYRMFCDVDFSMPIGEVDHFIPPKLRDYQVAIGSREAEGAVRYNEPPARHFTGRVFNLIVRLLLGLPKIHDTQCGFKSFSAEAAERLFRTQKIDGWAFDAEVLFIAKHFGYEIIEVPVQWYYDGNSKVNVLRDSVKMFRELLQIRQNYRKGLYN